MANARRRVAGTRQGRPGLPAWVWPWIMLIAGLVLGWAAYYVYQHEPKPKPAAPRTALTVPRAVRPHRSQFDFYNMLPEVETVLPRPRGRGTSQKGPAHAATRPPAGDHYELQAASFPDFSEADHMKARLALHGLEAHIQKVSIEGRGVYYRLRLGPFFNVTAMNRVDQKLARLGIHPMRLDVHPLARTRNH